MMVSGMTLGMFLMMLVGSHPIMLPAQVVAGAAAGARSYVGLASGDGTTGADDVALVHLYDVQGLAAKGRLLACRTGSEWKPGAFCPASLVEGRELRVFTGQGGITGRWNVERGEQVGEGLDTEMVLVGKLTAPLGPTSAAGDDALQVPFALLGESRHLVEPPATDGIGPDELTAMLELGKSSARMNRRMSEGMKPGQFAVADLSPSHREVVFVAGSSRPDGALDDVPLPSASILFAHDPDVHDGRWARYVVVQVISKETDARRFERYRLAAVLDIDGDGNREVLVRGRSVLGDRFRLFELSEDEVRFVPIADWAGVARQADSAPTSSR